MHFVDQNGVLALIRLPHDGGHYGHSHLLGILLDFKDRSFSLMLCI